MRIPMGDKDSLRDVMGLFIRLGFVMSRNRKDDLSGIYWGELPSNLRCEKIPEDTDQDRYEIYRREDGVLVGSVVYKRAIYDTWVRCDINPEAASALPVSAAAAAAAVGGGSSAPAVIAVAAAAASSASASSAGAGLFAGVGGVGATVATSGASSASVSLTTVDVSKLKECLEFLFRILNRGGIEKGYLSDVESLLKQIKALQARSPESYAILIASDRRYQDLQAQFPDWKMTAEKRRDLDAQEQSIASLMQDPATLALLAGAGVTSAAELAEARAQMEFITTLRREHPEMSPEERITLLVAYMLSRGGASGGASDSSPSPGRR